MNLHVCFCTHFNAPMTTKQGNCLICLNERSNDLIRLKCNHEACRSCLEQQINARWSGKRITFNFLKCPFCRQLLDHPDLTKSMTPHIILQNNVQEICLQKCIEEELIENLEKLVKMDRKQALTISSNELVCFVCKECSKPFAAGRVDCAALDGIDVENIICNECLWKNPSPFKCQFYPGLQEAIVKCDFCCDVAQFNCGSGMYCQNCHSGVLANNQPLFDPRNGGVRNIGQGEICPGPKKCRLGVAHPPNGKSGTAFVIGCIHGCKAS